MQKRQTFAIISHPDAGKTTITEQLLLLSGSIKLAGTVKARKSARHATSDWMDLEKQRGISVSTSVMQIRYKDAVINLLDTPGHADFSEDTYRTLTAVDSALMVIDAAKGVEARTIKLMEICRMRQMPIFTFINKLDREGQDPFDILDDIEKKLSIHCVPMNWPLGRGRHFRGVYQFSENKFYVYPSKGERKKLDMNVIEDIDSKALRDNFEEEAVKLEQDIDMIRGAMNPFDENSFLTGDMSPVYFDSSGFTSRLTACLG